VRQMYVVPLADWLRREPAVSGYTRSDKHSDVYEAIEQLRKRPELLLKIRGDAKKQHVVLEYARRKKIKLRTFVDEGFVFMRRREIKPVKIDGQAVFPTTAAEWRAIQRKRDAQNAANLSGSKP